MWQDILKIYLNKKLYENKTIFHQFKSLNSDYERVCFFINKFHLPESNDFSDLCKFYKINANLSGKNSQLSDKYRLIGNNFYVRKEFNASFNNYLLSIQYAENQSGQLLLAYSNRSALFFELKLYGQCLVDLKQIKSLNNNYYPKNLEKKLFIREANCYYYLNQPKNLENILENLDATGDVIEKFKKFCEISNENGEILDESGSTDSCLDEIHPKYVHMSNLLDVKYSKQNGRYVILNQTELKKQNKDKINVGEVLFHEKAYCSILLPEYQKFYCENCYKEICSDDGNYKYLNIEFCNYCLNVVFCSSKCKLESTNSYHKHECLILNLLYDLGIAHLAYRVIAKTDFNMLKTQYNDKIKHETDTNQSLERYFNEGNLYTSSNYDTIFNLVTNSSNTHVDDLFQYTITSILLSKLYFLGKKNVDNDDLFLIGTLICRHIQQAICNAHAITKLECGSRDEQPASGNTYSYEQVRYATALYPTVSLMNHSCDPNVICSFKVDSNEIIIKSSRNITVDDDAGEVHIWNCYGPHYLKMSYLERKQVLSEQYHFNCECKYCLIESDNLELNEKNIQNYGFKCVSCNEILKNIKCEICNYEQSLAEYKTNLKKIKVLMKKSDIKSLIECCKLNERLFLEIDRYESTKVSVQNSYYLINYCKLLDKIARCLCETNSFENGSNYLIKSIKLLKFIYNGQYNIEIAMELFKLSEILCNCKKFSPALDSVNEAIDILTKISNTKSQLFQQFVQHKENIMTCLHK